MMIIVQYYNISSEILFIYLPDRIQEELYVKTTLFLIFTIQIITKTYFEEDR